MTAATAPRYCLYKSAQRTVMVRQFRYPAYVNGYDDLLIEAAAGVLTAKRPRWIRAEAEEETGYRLGEVWKDLRSLSSPGSVTEKLHFSSPSTILDAHQ